MTDTARTTPVWISEPPLTRVVGQQTGGVAPQTMPAALHLVDQALQREAKAIERQENAEAELANMIDLSVEVGRLGNFLRHMRADRDDLREQRDEWRDKYDAAQCRMDEMAAEIRELKAAVQ